MAACLRAPIAYPIRYSPPTESARSPRNFKLNRGAFRVQNSANFGSRLLNPKDPFVQKLAFAAKHTPELLKRSKCDSDAPPFLDLLDSPMESTEYERDWMDEVKYDNFGEDSVPPDIPSKIFDMGIVFLGMPLYPLVTELIMQQLLYLEWKNKKKEIILYVNCTGTTDTDNKLVGMETDGFAIYDTIMRLQNRVSTFCFGHAKGVACLLLAAGRKGGRAMTPHAIASIQLPRTHSIGEWKATDVVTRARESLKDRDTFAKLLADRTGNSKKVVAEKMRKSFLMDAIQAKEFGVVDHICWRNQPEFKEHMESKEKYLQDTYYGI